MVQYVRSILLAEPRDHALRRNVVIGCIQLALALAALLIGLRVSLVLLVWFLGLSLLLNGIGSRVFADRTTLAVLLRLLAVVSLILAAASLMVMVTNDMSAL